VEPGCRDGNHRPIGRKLFTTCNKGLDRRCFRVRPRILMSGPACGKCNVEVAIPLSLSLLTATTRKDTRKLEQMYGPPPFRKRKVKVAGWSAQMYTAFVGEGFSGP
jgi:hypothetical protein